MTPSHFHNSSKYFWKIFGRETKKKERRTMMLSYWDYVLMLALGLGLLSAQLPAHGASPDQPGQKASADLMNKEQESIGKASLRKTPHGVFIHLTIKKAAGHACLPCA
jgi:hypothetical protein